MVRALLDGGKTHPRRAVAPPRVRSSFVLEDHGTGWWPYQSDDGETSLCNDGMEHPYCCPYGQPGDRLWVRESFAHVYRDNREPEHRSPEDVAYMAGGMQPDHDVYGSWKPSIHMPRWASRILLEVTDVRVERLKDISEADAVAEGIVPQRGGGFGLPDTTHYHSADPRMSYWALWEAINGSGSVESNPWVWAVSFRRIKP